MARIFVTGSSEGLGFLAGEYLVRQGHDVVFHARTAEKAEKLRRQVPQAAAVVVGDLAHLAFIRSVAAQANERGPYQAVIHNVGVGESGARHTSDDGMPVVFAVNVLAPYMLTALIKRPQRLIYLSSGMHYGASPGRLSSYWNSGAWRGTMSYSESKFLDATLAFAIAHKWPDVFSNAVDPGWVPTRMGGASAPDSLEDGFMTQAWLAVSEAAEAKVSGHYFRNRAQKAPDAGTQSAAMQDSLLALCAEISGLRL